MSLSFPVLLLLLLLLLCGLWDGGILPLHTVETHEIRCGKQPMC